MRDHLQETLYNVVRESHPREVASTRFGNMLLFIPTIMVSFFQTSEWTHFLGHRDTRDPELVFAVKSNLKKFSYCRYYSGPMSHEPMGSGQQQWTSFGTRTQSTEPRGSEATGSLGLGLGSWASWVRRRTHLSLVFASVP